MMTEGERSQRAVRAKLELGATEQAFADLRSALVDRWAATSIDQVATREKLFMGVQTLDAVRKALIRAAQDGEVLKHGAEIAELLAPADADRRR